MKDLKICSKGLTEKTLIHYGASLKEDLDLQNLLKIWKKLYGNLLQDDKITIRWFEERITLTKGLAILMLNGTSVMIMKMNYNHLGIRHDNKKRDTKEREECCWIPHLCTGIFYLKGHEGVMNEVPDGAAIFASSYWLRNSDMYRV
ncbi:hypothetical protein Tco_0549400 [Tanacetum coccineum]